MDAERREAATPARTGGPRRRPGARVYPELPSIAPNEPTQVAEWQTGAPPGAYDDPYWRAKWWVGAVPISKRHDQPRDTAPTNGETTSTAVKNGGWATHCWSRGRPSQTRWGYQCELAGLLNKNLTEVSGTRVPSSQPISPENQGTDFRFAEHRMETNGHGGSTLPPRCVMMRAWIDAPWNGSATTS